MERVLKVRIVDEDDTLLETVEVVIGPKDEPVTLAAHIADRIARHFETKED